MIIVILGPTGVGKTKLSIELAKKLNGEIINADSTQIYRGLDIATAKIKEEEKEGIIHHLFDIKDIKEDYSVFDYQNDARLKIEEIKSKGKTPILVGGTGLYIKACLYNYSFEDETPRLDYSNYNNEELYQRLLEVDPNTKVHKNNRQRVERSLNYYENNSKPISEKGNNNELLYDAIFIGLTTDRDNLYNIINNRFDHMLDSGLLEEVKKIYDSNIRTKAIMTPIGYKEILPYFENKETLENCIEKCKQNSRRYAKRQYTWFNNKMNVNWFEVNFKNFNETVNEVLEFINKKND